MKPVWLLCYQRTGTHLLYDYLNQTGLFDPPFEEWMNLYQNKLPIPKWEPWYDRLDTTPEYCAQNLPPFCSVHRLHYDNFFTDEHKGLIEEGLPGLRYIRLRRKDHIAVAVSIYIARETETWWVNNEEEKRQHNEKRFKINPRRLFQIYLNHLDFYHCWDSYLEGEEFLDLHYEDLIDNRHETLKKTFGYLGIDQEPSVTTKSLQNEHPMKQALYELLEDAIDTGVVNYSKVIPPPELPIPLM